MTEWVTLNSLTISINNTPNIITDIRKNPSGFIYLSKPLYRAWDCIQIVLTHWLYNNSCVTVQTPNAIVKIRLTNTRSWFFSLLPSHWDYINGNLAQYLVNAYIQFLIKWFTPLALSKQLDSVCHFGLNVELCRQPEVLFWWYACRMSDCMI